VANTRKKVLSNCTDEVEDLFRKIFRLDQEKRITFSEIRQHPVFIKNFPKSSPESLILYKTKFKSAFLTKGKGHQMESNKKLNLKVGELKERLSIPSTICM
jgi:serine/threonine protein kinase